MVSSDSLSSRYFMRQEVQGFVTVLLCSYSWPRLISAWQLVKGARHMGVARAHDLTKPTDPKICQLGWPCMSGRAIHISSNTSMDFCQCWFSANLMFPKEDFAELSASSSFLCVYIFFPFDTCLTCISGKHS